MKINVLSPSVYNMIAAGEVVERPSSVVKELLENTVDAGATQVDVKIERGGIGLIQISDNGIGITSDDIETAFLPHATSKISTYEDLSTISTLGFRGEALPSIASISKIEMVSKNKDADFATKLILDGGKVVSKEFVSRQNGTIISVFDLFYNTPARLKFLKKESSEQRYIIDTVKNFALSNPQLNITLSDEKGLLLSQNNGTLFDSLFSVFDSKTIENLVEIPVFTANSITVRGYTSKIAFQKPNRTHQYIMVNGRNIKDQTITIAVEKAYENYVMKRSFPVFVLDIVVPFDDVDVNVHPSKTEVRFTNPKAIFSTVYHALLSAIEKQSFEDKINLSKPNTEPEIKTENYFQPRIETAFLYGKSAPKNTNFQINNSKNSQLKDDILSSFELNKKNISNQFVSDEKNIIADNRNLFKERLETLSNFKYASNNSNDVESDCKYKSLENEARSNNQGKEIGNKYFTNSYKKEIYDDSNTILTSDIHNISEQANDSNPILSEKNVANKSCDFELTYNSQQSNGVFDGKIIGQIFDTYIILERDEKVYIIDQHAAHERILYDKIKSSMSNDFTQSLLVPYQLDISEIEKDYILNNISQFSSIGFDFRQDNENIYLHSVPAFFAKLNVSKLINSLLTDVSSLKELNAFEMLKDTLCQQACKQAIKGGQSLSAEQLEYVINNFMDDNGNLPSECPHGRPAVVTITKSQIEKLFKRIV